MSVNPLEFCVVKFVDELGLTYRENVWLTDLPRLVREVVKFLGETPLESLEVDFGVDPVRGSDGFYRDFWAGFSK